MKHNLLSLPENVSPGKRVVLIIVLAVFLVLAFLSYQHSPIFGKVPDVNFSASPTVGAASLTVDFHGSVGIITGRAWYFGDEDFRNHWELTSSNTDQSLGRAGHSSVVLEDDSIVLMGGTDGTSNFNDVLRSVDQGKTWIQVTGDAEWSPRSGHEGVVLSDGSIVLMGGVDDDDYFNDVWRSTDRGATWTRVAETPAWNPRSGHASVVIDDDRIILMGGRDENDFYNDVWRSTDNGATWLQMMGTGGLRWSERAGHNAVELSDDSIVLIGGYCFASTQSLTDVWRSTDNGNNWTQLTTSAPFGLNMNSSSVVLSDDSIIHISGLFDIQRDSDLVWRSTDNGTTWVVLSNAAGWGTRYNHSCVALPDDSIVMAGGYGDNDEDVWFSPDGGASWGRQNSPWPARSDHAGVALDDGSILLMGGFVDEFPGFASDVWRSTDKGESWTLAISSAGWIPRRGHTAEVLTDGSVIIMGGMSQWAMLNDVWRSTDEGSSWVELDQPAGTKKWSPRAGLSSVVLPGGEILVMGGYNDVYQPLNDIWVSTGKGSDWDEVPQPSGAARWTPRSGHASVALPDGSIVLVGGYDGSSYLDDIWHSNDGGSSWRMVAGQSPFPARSGHSMVAMPDNSIVLMGGREETKRLNDIWRSTDRGATWHSLTPFKKPAWSARSDHTGVALVDGSIVLAGGYSDSNRNDVWRLETAGSTATNPTHTYTEPGSYTVTLQVYGLGGVNRAQREDYITVYPRDGRVLDGSDVTIDDVIAVLSHLLGLSDLREDYPPGAYYRAQVCGGDDVALGDAILMVRYLVGLISEFPGE